MCGLARPRGLYVGWFKVYTEVNTAPRTQSEEETRLARRNQGAARTELGSSYFMLQLAAQAVAAMRIRSWAMCFASASWRLSCIILALVRGLHTTLSHTIHYYTTLHYTLCYITLYCHFLSYTVLSCMVLYYTTLDCNISYSMVYHIVLCCTILYFIILIENYITLY